MIQKTFPRHKTAENYAEIHNIVTGIRVCITEQYFFEGIPKHKALITYYTVSENELHEKTGKNILISEANEGIEFIKSETKLYYKYIAIYKKDEIQYKVYKKLGKNQLTTQKMAIVKFRFNKEKEQFISNVIVQSNTEILPEFFANEIVNSLKGDFADRIINTCNTIAQYKKDF